MHSITAKQTVAFAILSPNFESYTHIHLPLSSVLDSDFESNSRRYALIVLKHGNFALSYSIESYEC